MQRDDAFPRFLDLFNHRFLQLFFRAWADARPIAQHDRPKDDRFIAYIGSMIGIGTQPHRDLDAVPDAAKLAFAGLIAAQAKSASRLRSFIMGLFDVKVDIDEFVGSWLVFGPGDRSRLGQSNSGLGTSLSLGASIFSVQDKIRVRVYTKDMVQYQRFLADRRPMQATGGRGILLYRRPTRVGGGAGDSCRRGRADAAWQVRTTRLDKLDGTELGLDGRISTRCSLSSFRTRAPHSSSSRMILVAREAIKMTIAVRLNR